MLTHSGSSRHPCDEPDPPPQPPQSGDDAVRDYAYLAYRVTRHRSLAWLDERDDVYNDALMALWDAGESWESRGGQFAPYAMQRMGWRIADGMRKRHGRKGLHRGEVDTLDIPTDELPETATVDNCEFDDADAAADALTAVLKACTHPREKAFVAMRVAGHTDPEIAAVMGISEGRVSQIRHAIRVKYAAFVASH